MGLDSEKPATVWMVHNTMSFACGMRTEHPPPTSIVTASVETDACQHVLSDDALCCNGVTSDVRWLGGAPETTWLSILRRQRGNVRPNRWGTCHQRSFVQLMLQRRRRRRPFFGPGFGLAPAGTLKLPAECVEGAPPSATTAPQSLQDRGMLWRKAWGPAPSSRHRRGPRAPPG